jgi:tripartite-type tricarboxylate transporter receptor subunit TctC
MFKNKYLYVYLGLAAAAAAGAADAAQPYPQRPVRVIVPVSAGGGVDTIARIVSDQLSMAMGERFVVDNRTGAGGTIGVEIAAHATPDGHTLLVSSSSLVTNAAVQSVRYDPIKDFQPVTKLTSNPYMVVTGASYPAASLKDLIAAAKAKPGTISYASSGTGGILHLAAELLCVMSGVQMTHVPYRGVADGYPAVISGQVTWVMANPLSALTLIRAGRIKALAVTTGKRSTLLPDVPTIAESGVPGYDVSAWFSLFAPAGVPDAIVQRLATEAAKAVRSPAIASRMAAEGAEVGGNSPREFAAEVKAEYEKWRSLVRKTGMKPQ